MNKKKGILKRNSNIVIRIDKNEFEMKDGRVFYHPEKLEIIPKIEEFQEMYDYWDNVIREKND